MQFYLFLYIGMVRFCALETPFPSMGKNLGRLPLKVLSTLRRRLHAEHPDWNCNLPRILIRDSGTTLQTIQNLVQQLCTVAIVDKHSSVMWAFCRQWAWDQHIQFAQEEG